MRERRIEKPLALSIPLLGFLFATTSCSAKQSVRNAPVEYSATPFRLESVQWSEPYNGPLGYPKGAQRLPGYRLWLRRRDLLRAIPRGIPLRVALALAC